MRDQSGDRWTDGKYIWVVVGEFPGRPGLVALSPDLDVSLDQQRVIPPGGLCRADELAGDTAAMLIDGYGNIRIRRVTGPLSS